MKIIENILRNGVEGTPEMIYNWSKMFAYISSKGLPNNMLRFAKDFEKYFISPEIDFVSEFDDLDLGDIKEYLQQEKRKGKVEFIRNRKSYRAKDPYNLEFSKNLREVIFIARESVYHPIYFLRSKISSACNFLKLKQQYKMEILIAITEAIENAIKYSDTDPIIIEHLFDKEQSQYSIKMINSIRKENMDKVSDEEKFSQNTSLMKGVFVMHKLFDVFNVDHNSEENLVTIKGTKNCN